MRINKFFSVFLSLLMVCSIFGGLSVSATTIDKTHTYTVVGDAPGKVVPTETTHYVAGEAGLCNGINWEKDNEINKMTKNQDGSYEITLKGVNPKTDGTPYEFYVTTNGQWEPGYVYYGDRKSVV